MFILDPMANPVISEKSIYLIQITLFNVSFTFLVSMFQSSATDHKFRSEAQDNTSHTFTKILCKDLDVQP